MFTIEIALIVSLKGLYALPFSSDVKCLFMHIK